MARMRRRFGHVSAERVLSGPGLVNLYQTLAERAARRPSPSARADRRPRAGETDPLCRAAAGLFCAMLGTVAGDLALTLGARGGVFIAGGIVPRLGASLAQSRFRAPLRGQGTLLAYLAAIPTYVVPIPSRRFWVSPRSSTTATLTADAPADSLWHDPAGVGLLAVYGLIVGGARRASLAAEPARGFSVLRRGRDRVGGAGGVAGALDAACRPAIARRRSLEPRALPSPCLARSLRIKERR